MALPAQHTDTRDGCLSLQLLQSEMAPCVPHDSSQTPTKLLNPRATSTHHTRAVVREGAGRVLRRGEREMRHTRAAVCFNTGRNKPKGVLPSTNPLLLPA